MNSMTPLKRMMDCEVALPDHEGRKGYYMLTFSGRRYFPCDPRPEEIFIADIAHHLAMQCRFNGAVTGFYSVAEHSYWASFDGSEDEALERLMHDAAEAYIGDMIRPLKMLPELREPFSEIEHRNEVAIAERFGLNFPWPASVKKADEAICTAEMKQIMVAPTKNDLHDASRIADVTIRCWDWRLARARFTHRFYELATARNTPIF